MVLCVSVVLSVGQRRTGLLQRGRGGSRGRSAPFESQTIERKLKPQSFLFFARETVSRVDLTAPPPFVGSVAPCWVGRPLTESWLSFQTGTNKVTMTLLEHFRPSHQLSGHPQIP